MNLKVYIDINIWKGIFTYNHDNPTKDSFKNGNLSKNS